MKLPRITIRRLMILVAIVAVMLAATIWADARRAHFNRLVRQYYDERYRTVAFSYSGPGGEIMERRMKADAEKGAKRSVYYSGLIEKYERAALYPWLPVAPDPPEPK